MGSSRPIWRVVTVFHSFLNCSLVDVLLSTTMAEPSGRCVLFGGDKQKDTGTARA
jgi:hypothetical protein